MPVVDFVKLAKPRPWVPPRLAVSTPRAARMACVIFVSFARVSSAAPPNLSSPGKPKPRKLPADPFSFRSGRLNGATERARTMASANIGTFRAGARRAAEQRAGREAARTADRDPTKAVLSWDPSTGRRNEPDRRHGPMVPWRTFGADRHPSFPGGGRDPGQLGELDSGFVRGVTSGSLRAWAPAFAGVQVRSRSS